MGEKAGVRILTPGGPLAAFWQALDRPKVVLGIIAGYCLLHFLARISLSPVFTLDEAEQMLFAQELSLGYRFRHPPLITWLTWGTQSVAGLSLVTLAAMKYLIMGAGFWAYALAAKGITGSWRMALFATAGFWLTYTVGYYPHLDLMHTVLLMSLLCTGLWLLVRLLREEAGPGLYALAGAAMAAGVLAKYVFGIFVVAAVCAVLLTPAARQRVSLQGLAIAGGVFALVLVPYFAWALAHEYSLYGLAQSVTQREAASEIFLFRWLKGSFALALALAEFTLPFSVIFAALFWPALRPLPLPANDGSDAVILKTVLERIMLGGGALMLAAVILVGATDFKARWMHQVLVPLPAYLFLRLVLRGSLPEPRLRLYVAIGLAVGFLALAARFIAYEANLAKCKNCWEYQPFAAYALGLREAGFETGTILTDSMYVGGNLRAKFPEARIVVPGYPEDIFPPPGAELGPGPGSGPGSGRCLLVWLGGEKTLPQPLFELASETLGARGVQKARPEVLVRPLGGGKTAALHYILFDAPESRCR